MLNLPQAIEYSVEQIHIDRALSVENFRTWHRGVFVGPDNQAVSRGEYCPNALALHDVLQEYFPGSKITKIFCGETILAFNVNGERHYYNLGSNAKTVVKKFDDHTLHGYEHGYSPPHPAKCTAFLKE